MKPLVLLIFSQLFLFSACNKSTDANVQYKLFPSTCQNYGKTDEAVKVCFQKVVSDSRCPIGAVCITAGQCIADFIFTKEDVQYPLRLSTVKLTNIAPRDTIIQGYKIEFVDLLPYPELNTPPTATPQAEVRVTKM